MMDTTALEQALRATVERLVDSRLGSLREQLGRELRGEISAALANLPGGDAVATTAPPAAPALAALNQCISRILQPKGQSEVMGAYLQSSAEFAGRCALFVRRADGFAFWRAEGFGGEAAGGLRSLSVPVSQPGIFKDLNDSQQAISRSRSPDMFPPAFERALGDSAEESLYLLPVVVQGRVVAALYADAGSRSAGSVERSALEILARVAGLSLETAAGRATGLAERPVPTAAVAEATPAIPLEEAQSQPASSLTGGAETISADGEQAAPRSGALPQEGPPPGSFAASIPVSPGTASAVASPPDAESLPEEDRESHRKAHRFARVAVQDLLSYHKTKIEEGRTNKNLYLLLKEDIEKTRENYKKRFGQTAARSFDYLHYELVLKLAGNDPASLGAQYPGPSEGE